MREDVTYVTSSLIGYDFAAHHDLLYIIETKPSTTKPCVYFIGWTVMGDSKGGQGPDCPACRTTLVATRFRVAVICPIIQVPHCIRVFFYFV